MKTYKINLNEDTIVIETDNKGTAYYLQCIETTNNPEYNAAIDGMQTLLLTLVAGGMDISRQIEINSIKLAYESLQEDYN